MNKDYIIENKYITIKTDIKHVAGYATVVLKCLEKHRIPYSYLGTYDDDGVKKYELFFNQSVNVIDEKEVFLLKLNGRISNCNEDIKKAFEEMRI